MTGMAERLTSADPEPPTWSQVDAGGRRWVRAPQLHVEGATYWVPVDDLDGDPESWAKLAGNYGPATLLG